MEIKIIMFTGIVDKDGVFEEYKINEEYLLENGFKSDLENIKEWGNESTYNIWFRKSNDTIVYDELKILEKIPYTWLIRDLYVNTMEMKD